MANSRGIYAIRRVVSPSSYELFDEIKDELEVEFRGSDRLFTPETLLLTVIGFSRFSKKHKLNGPDTRQIINAVPSLHENITAQIGRLGVFGSGNGMKLAVNVESEELVDEYQACRRAYADRGYPLNERVMRADVFKPHCSIGYLHAANAGHHRENLKRYNKMIEFALHEQIILEPPVLRD